MEREGGESMCPFGSRVELKHAKNMLFQDIELEQKYTCHNSYFRKGRNCCRHHRLELLFSLFSFHYDKIETTMACFRDKML